MNTLDLLEHDHSVLTEILQSRRAVPMNKMAETERIAWQMYLAILADAINTLDSLIDHLTSHGKGSN